ncbi:hypothetical protein ACFQ1L_23805 [Phytohabitans flavus]|uniref:hypothetical protein n=1 Tax=Phytohabitans flavus TaxID=1076124 RepID=UPI003631344D
MARAGGVRAADPHAGRGRAGRRPGPRDRPRGGPQARRRRQPPLSIGAAAGPAGKLAETADLARRISGVAPAQPRPECLHTVADVLVELAVSQLPAVDRWLAT